MIIGIILLLKCVLLFYFSDATSIKLNKFIADTALNGYKCYDDNVTFSMTNSATACALACWKEAACLSMIYYPETGQCTGCISFLGENGTDLSKFYIPEHRYIGCYSDDPRLTNGSGFRDMSLTTQLCLAFCLSEDYMYTITEYGMDCRCGNNVDFVNAFKKPEAACSFECAGDSSQTCGGYWIGSLYRTGL